VGAIFGAAAVSNVCGNTRALFSSLFLTMQQQQKKSNGKFSRNKKFFKI